MGDDYDHLWENGFGHQGEVAYAKIPNYSELPAEFMTGTQTTQPQLGGMYA